jgi:hypothetical protein
MSSVSAVNEKYKLSSKTVFAGVSKVDKIFVLPFLTASFVISIRSHLS